MRRKKWSKNKQGRGARGEGTGGGAGGGGAVQGPYLPPAAAPSDSFQSSSMKKTAKHVADDVETTLQAQFSSLDLLIEIRNTKHEIKYQIYS